MRSGISLRSLFDHFLQAVKGQNTEFTSGNIKKAIFYLAIPMVLEMIMESLFAVVDIFFVGKISVSAVAAVGLTESILTIIYSVSIGLSMAATAVVARRIGEQKPKEAADAAFQAILLATFVAIIVGIFGYIYSQDMLQLMGAGPEIIKSGYRYTQVIFAGNVSVMLLFLINGVFRGAGNAAIAMRTLWIANGINIILDPLLIFGLGPIPAYGLEGAAWATTIGRTVGVVYQLFYLVNGRSLIKIMRRNVYLDFSTIINLIRISLGGMGQFLIESASWIFLIRLVAASGGVALAGYTIAIRILMFTLLPAFGLANAAATLVGQNLGAKHPERAEKSVWLSAKYNAYFLGICSIAFIFFGSFFIRIFNPDPEVIKVGTQALLIICLGYTLFAYGMVISQSFNGAGDTLTPTLINIALFWFIQIPLAYLLAIHFGLAVTGVFITIAFCHSLHAVVSIYFFKKGRWKRVKV